MRPNRTRKKMNYQSLENRKLLAADFGMSATPIGMMNFQGREVVEVQEFAINEIGFEQMMGDFSVGQMDPFGGASYTMGKATNVPSFVFGGSGFEALNRSFATQMESGFPGEVFREADFVEPMVFDGWVEADQFVFEMGDIGGLEYEGEFDFDFFGGFFGEPGLGIEDGDFEEFDPIVFENGFLDVSDGSDGVFGTFDADNTEESYSFIASKNGEANVVLATNVSDGELNVELTDAEGNIIEPTAADSDPGFSKWTYDIEGGEIYSLILSGSEGVSGDYQLTVSVEAAEPVDVHADEVGEDATVLEFNGGIAETLSQLETDGDRDVFQFVAPAAGEAILQASDLGIDSDLNLSVAVYDTNGDEVVAGSTNASVTLEFEVAEGETYYVAVNAAEGQTGEYHFAVISDSAFPIDEGVDEAGGDDSFDDDDAYDDGVEVDDETDFEVEEGDDIVDVDVEDLDESEVGDNADFEDGSVEVVENVEIGDEVVIVDIEELEEVAGKIEMVEMDMDNLDESEASGFSDLVFDFGAWALVGAIAESSDAEDADTELPESGSGKISDITLVGESPSALKLSAYEVAVEIDLNDLDEFELDNIFSTNWFEQEFNWI